MTLVREILSLSFLPATPSSPSWTLEGLFEPTLRLSSALESPHALLPDLQRYKDTCRCATLGMDVPRHCQKKDKANLDCVFVENTLFYTDP